MRGVHDSGDVVLGEVTREAVRSTEASDPDFADRKPRVRDAARE
jgi:hypothetical protein